MAFNQPNYYPYQYNGMFNQNYSMSNYSQPSYQQNNQQIQPIAVQPTLPPPTVNQSQQYSMISGKIVENSDMVRVAEIPIGGYGVFPLTDSSKVYIKMYDKEGNLQTYLYELVQTNESSEKNNNSYSDKLSEIYEYVTRIDKKVDSLKSNPSTKKKKVEVSEEDE